MFTHTTQVPIDSVSTLSETAEINISPAEEKVPPLAMTQSFIARLLLLRLIQCLRSQRGWRIPLGRRTGILYVYPDCTITPLTTLTIQQWLPPNLLLLFRDLLIQTLLRHHFRRPCFFLGLINANIWNLNVHHQSSLRMLWFTTRQSTFCIVMYWCMTTVIFVVRTPSFHNTGQLFCWLLGFLLMIQMRTFAVQGQKMSTSARNCRL